MPLDTTQSAPGNRYSGPDGKDYDIIARIATDAGPFVITRRADAGPLGAGVLISEGDLRDNEDVAFVSTIAAAKADAAEKLADEEAAQIAADRQARIDAANAATGATDATGGDEESAPAPTPTPTP